MRHQQMPHHGAQALGVRRDVVAVKRGDDDAGIGELGCRAAIAPYDAEDRGSALTGQLERDDQVGRHALLGVTATDGEDEQRVAVGQP